MSTLAYAIKTSAKKRLLYTPVWLWIAFAVASTIFVLFPEIDISASRHFFTPGVGFEARGTWLEQLSNSSVGFLLICGNLAFITLALLPRLARRLKIRLNPKQLLYLLLLLALGPGLIVNTLLKEHWGRARPVKIEQFGGSSRFTPAFIPSDQEGKSFSSGHAAASAYWIIAVLLLAPRQTWLLYMAVLYSLGVSWMRVAAGAHFLSDIVTSYFIVAIVAIALYEIIFVQDISAARILERRASALYRFKLQLVRIVPRCAKPFGIPPLFRRLRQRPNPRRRPPSAEK